MRRQRLIPCPRQNVAGKCHRQDEISQNKNQKMKLTASFVRFAALSGAAVVAYPKLSTRRGIGASGYSEIQGRVLMEGDSATSNEYPNLPALDRLFYELLDYLNAMTYAGGASRALDHAEDRALAASAATFERMRITTDTSLLEDKSFDDTDNPVRIQAILNEILPEVLLTWQDALYGKPVVGSLDFQNLQGTSQGKCLDSELPFDSVDDTDFFLMVEGLNKVEPCDTMILKAVASPCGFDNYPSYNVRAAKLTICLDRIQVKDSQVQEIDDQKTILLNEMAHAFGALIDFSIFFTNPVTGLPYGQMNQGATCNDGSTLPYMPSNIAASSYGSNGFQHDVFELTTPIATQVARNVFGCQEMTGVRLEKQSNSGGPVGKCFGPYLDARLFFDELLGSTTNTLEDGNKLSPLTLAVLEDTGWYSPDYSKSTELVFGAGAGCGFVEKDCIDRSSGMENPSSRDFFCDEQDKTILRCDPTHSATAFCAGSIFANPPVEFQYFSNDESFGGVSPQLDYCPVATLFPSPCESGSKCFLRTDYVRNLDASVCLPAECKEGKHEVKITFNDKDYKCKEDFEELSIDDLGTVICPRISAICRDWTCKSHCSGRGICDWEAKKGPECDCFDKDDKTDGCYETVLDFTVTQNSPPEDKKKKKKEKKPKKQMRRRH